VTASPFSRATLITGFSALGLSDKEILGREFVVYDALYAECQRRVKAK